MWNPTIPQDEKFSTVHVEANHRDQLMGLEDLAYDQRKYKPTQQQAMTQGVWKTEDEKIDIFSTSIHKIR